MQIMSRRSSVLYTITALLLLLLQRTSAQTCSTEAIDDYRNCVAANPCECANCDDDPSDEFPVIQIGLPDSCQDLMRTMCPLVRCCSICEAQAAAVYECSTNVIATQFLQRTCPLVCGGYPLQDVNCQPTTPPTPVPTRLATPSPTITPTAPATSDAPSDSPSNAPSQLPTVDAPRTFAAATAEVTSSAGSVMSKSVVLALFATACVLLLV